jgi:hypothetical protein
VPVFWNIQGGWRAAERLFLAFGVTNAATPRLVSVTRLGDGGNWTGFSDAFAAEGKLYVSHDVTTYASVGGQGKPLGKDEGPFIFFNYWQPDAWETRHFLDVLDFADATNPGGAYAGGFPRHAPGALARRPARSRRRPEPDQHRRLDRLPACARL